MKAAGKTISVTIVVIVSQTTICTVAKLLLELYGYTCQQILVDHSNIGIVICCLICAVMNSFFSVYGTWCKKR